MRILVEKVFELLGLCTARPEPPLEGDAVRSGRRRVGQNFREMPRMIRRADRRRCGSQVITIMWIMMLMMMVMTRVHRMLSLVAGHVVLERSRGDTVWTVRLRGRGSWGGRAVGKFLPRSSARLMTANLSWLRLKRGVEILGLFLLSFLVRRPFVLEPCVQGLGRPFVGKGAWREERVSHIG